MEYGTTKKAAKEASATAAEGFLSFSGILTTVASGAVLWRRLAKVQRGLCYDAMSSYGLESLGFKAVSLEVTIMMLTSHQSSFTAKIATKDIL